MKKVISVLLAATMVATLSGCSNLRRNSKYAQTAVKEVVNIKPEKGAHLTIWAADDQKAWIKQVADKYTGKYGVKVTIQKVDDYNVVSKLQTDGPAGVGADVFMSAHDALGTFAAGGLVRENDVTVSRIKNDCVSAALNAATYNGKVYGYPMSLTTYVLLYNKKIISKPASTFAEIKNFAKTFNDAKSSKYALMFPVTETFYVTSFIQGYGGYIFGKDGKDGSDIGLNKSAAVNGLKFYQSLKAASPLSAQNENLDTVEGLFGQGNVAYEIAQVWAIQSAQKQGINVGVAPLPTMDNGKKPIPSATVTEMFVSTYSKYPKAAKLFAQMATSDDMLNLKMKMQSMVPVSKSLLSSDYVKNNEILSALADSAKTCIPSSNIAEMNYVWDPYLRAVQSIWDKNADAQSEMDKCVKTVKQQIQTNK